MGGLRNNPCCDNNMLPAALALLLCFVGETIGVDENGNGGRQPKLFYISSSTTTSTVSTHSVCYHILSTSNAVSYGVTCSKRRKRRMITDGTALADISPSRKADEEVDSDLVDSAEDTHRDKRYMNYWLTTTTTVTQYSYTVTSKIASLQCTPKIGWEYQSCPDPGR